MSTYYWTCFVCFLKSYTYLDFFSVRIFVCVFSEDPWSQTFYWMPVLLRWLYLAEDKKKKHPPQTSYSLTALFPHIMKSVEVGIPGRAATLETVLFCLCALLSLLNGYGNGPRGTNYLGFGNRRWLHSLQSKVTSGGHKGCSKFNPPAGRSIFKWRRHCGLGHGLWSRI